MGDRSSLPLLDPKAVRLRLDASGFLEGSVAGAPVEEVRARPAFPFSHPDLFIELRAPEPGLLGIVERLADLEPDCRRAVEAALRLQRFTPVIRRILSIRGHHHLYSWRVVTDRGEIAFQTRGRRQNIEEVSGDEYVVTDTDGNRYRVPRISELDARSLVHLRKVL